MMAMPVMFGFLALSAGICAMAANLPWVRALSFAVTIGLAATLWQVSLGRPRPPTFSVPTGTVVGYRFDEPRAIYVWMLPPGETVPTAFALPWSEHKAAELQEAAEQARRKGDPLEARRGERRRGPLGFSMLMQEGVRFQPGPHIALPPKALPNE